jgi:DNA-binding transcriptional ArsR family regulator
MNTIEAPPETENNYILYDLKKQKWVKDTITFKTDEINSYWEKTSIRCLCNFMNITGNAQVKLLTHLLKIKDTNNIIIGSAEKLAKDIKISRATASNTIRLLRKKGFIRMVQRGVWMLHPDVSRFGSDHKAIVLINTWSKIK